MTTPTAAAGAYAALSRISSPAAAAGSAAGATGGANFTDMLKNAVGGVMSSGQAADTQTQMAAAGKANIVDVVTAVAESEVAIETLVSVRDRMINAYEEIMRMPI